ncbi:hypothetical protein Tco_0781956 [Tanacetum coccineum]
MDVNSGVFSRKNGAYTDDSKKNGRLFKRAASMLVLIFEEKLAEKEVEIQILWNQLQQKSKSSTVEEIVKTHDPPYNYQYKERRYGKQAPVLTKKPGSDRGMFRGMSTSSLNDHVQEDRFANEVSNPRASDYSVTNRCDLFRPGTQSPPSLSQSSGSGKFDGLDLFSAPNQPPSTTPTPLPLS